MLGSLRVACPADAAPAAALTPVHFERSPACIFFGRGPPERATLQGGHHHADLEMPSLPLFRDRSRAARGGSLDDATTPEMKPSVTETVQREVEREGERTLRQIMNDARREFSRSVRRATRGIVRTR